MSDRGIRCFIEEGDGRRFLRRVSLFDAEALVAKQQAVASRNAKGRLHYLLFAPDKDLMPKLAYDYLRRPDIRNERLDGGSRLLQLHRISEEEGRASLSVLEGIATEPSKPKRQAEVIPIGDVRTAAAEAEAIQKTEAEEQKRRKEKVYGLNEHTA